jgi:hypothetical protein
VTGAGGLDLVVIVAAIAIGAFVKGATGGGLPQIAIPVMAAFLGVERSVVVMAIPGVVANGWLVWSHRAEASGTRDLPVMMACGAVGSVIGTMALKGLDARVLSAVLAGIAGALYVPQVGIINPGEFAPGNSIEAVIWVAVGGRGTLIGAALGAVVVNYAKTVFTSGPLAPYWLFMLGALFILVTLLLPKGIIGTFNAWWEPWKAQRISANVESAALEDGVSVSKPNPAE